MFHSTWVDDLRVAVLKHHADSPIRVTEERAERALAFLDLLPAATLEAPRIVVALDGEIALMWEQHDRCLVVVPEDGWIRFVVQFGREERKGRERFSFAVPTVVREILTQGFPRRDS
jgi:hypothetical protein